MLLIRGVTKVWKRYLRKFGKDTHAKLKERKCNVPEQNGQLVPSRSQGKTLILDEIFTSLWYYVNLLAQVIQHQSRNL